MRLPLFGALDAAVGRFSITMGTLGQVVGMVVAGARAIEREIRLQSMHQKVQLSHQYVLEMIESLPSGIIVINPTGSIININRKACQMLRSPAETFLNQNIFEKCGKFLSSTPQPG